MMIQQIRTDSILHRMDPLSKFISLLTITILVFAFKENWMFIAFFLFLSLGALLLGGVPVKTYFGTAWIFMLVGIGLFFFHMFVTRSGDIALSVGIIDIYYGGLSEGLKRMFTMVIIALSSLIFIWTTNPRRLLVAIVRIGINYRYAWAIFLALRFLPVFKVELDIIKDAQAVRGIPEGSGFKGKLEMYKRYLVPVLVSAVRKSNSVAIAMDCRTFGAYPERTFTDEFKWSVSGIALMSSLLILLITLILL